MREKLDAALRTLERAERAREQSAARGERTKSEGAYREMAPEHAAELDAQIDIGPVAGEHRERWRREEARLLEELEDVRQTMERLGIRKNVLPVLDRAAAAAPCPMRWNEMSGDGDARTCTHCKLTVVNVATSDAARALALLESLGADARLHRRADGTLLARDCPTGVARQRFFRVAPLALLALALAAGGLALHAARGGRSVTTRVAPDPPGPVARLRGAPSLHVSDAFTGLGGSENAQIDFARQGNTFAASVSCSSVLGGRASRDATIPATTVDAFLDAVASHSPGAEEASCTHTDDYPSIAVTVDGVPSVGLSVRNCSYQWHEDGVPLDEHRRRRAPADVFPSSHPDINAAFRAMLEAVHEGDCLSDARIPKKPATPTESDAHCTPPYTIDASGSKVWKRECL